MWRLLNLLALVAQELLSEDCFICFLGSEIVSPNIIQYQLL